MNKNKIYVNNPKEAWITDRFRKEWIKNNKTITTRSVYSSSVIWLIAPWRWRKINENILKNKKVVCTIHHIDRDKFEEEKENFYIRDNYVDVYHVPSKKTLKDLSEMTNKKIYEIPFWVNQDIYFPIENKNLLRSKYGIKENQYVVGSFQRDTEGHDLISPKLSKGPDLLIDNILELKKTKNNLIVILAGYRRQFVIKELERHNIDFKYFNKPNFTTVNNLYNCLDLYIVSSRVEGGPAAIIECASSKTPIVSTDVGNASQILNKKSIYSENSFLESQADVHTAYNNSLKYNIPEGMFEFTKMFEAINEN